MFADQLLGVRLLPHVCKVRVVDGGELACTAEIPACIWCTRGKEFTTAMKLLPLGTYHAILGMDWLEANSPMQLEWRAKLMEIATPEGPAHLRGHESVIFLSIDQRNAITKLVQDRGYFTYGVCLYDTTGI